MPKNVPKILLATAAIVVVAAAAFVAGNLRTSDLAGLSRLSLPGAATPAGGQKQSVTYDVIRATEMPSTNPDIAGRLELRQDNSLMVRPDSKGALGPLVEVVVTGQTGLYRNATGDFLGTPPAAGAAVQMVLAPYRLEQLAEGDRVIAWGARRGDRLVAEVVMVETVLAAATP